MNSHDKGVGYALASKEQRQAMSTRQIHIADIADAMLAGFKAEPELAACHLPLLSDEALARIHTESEKWRDQARERELENRLNAALQRLSLSERCYDDLRTILGSTNVPDDYDPVGDGNDGKARHVSWTEHKAKQMVREAGRASGYASDAKTAEERNALIERYVYACDKNRIPYNWNIFKMSTACLRRHVQTFEHMERLTRCDCNPERVAWFETRTHQETEQNLRKAMARIDATRAAIASYANGRINAGIISHLIETLAGSEDIPESDGWIGWQTFEKGHRPSRLNDKDMVEIETVGGGSNTLEVGVVAWEQVKRYRLAVGG